MTVAALMPTADRRRFIPRAIACFLEQQYPADWLVTLYVIDDGTDKVADLIPQNDRIFYETMSGKNTLGKKLNFGCEHHVADYYLTFDDDDFHSPTRIARQLEPLTRDYELSGTSKVFYHNIETDEGWLYSGYPHLWLGGMAWRRELWLRQKFQDRTIGVDTLWQQALKPKFLDVADPALFIASMHAGNACPKNTSTRSWKRATLPEFPRV